ncbi:MAG TPA: histidine phosphatase family protein, partial [Labilithrix sp.]|nr:histidine phosphatase family protein [Labilithrix sp.]
MASERDGGGSARSLASFALRSIQQLFWITHVTSLLLVRHGHTDGNGSGSHIRMSGSTDLPLSAAGRCEAELVGAYVAQEHSSRIVYSSPLIRALDTASAIAHRIGVVPRVADGLSEIDCG